MQTAYEKQALAEYDRQGLDAAQEKIDDLKIAYGEALALSATHPLVVEKLRSLQQSLLAEIHGVKARLAFEHSASVAGLLKI
jgi:hypothetical protein